MDEQNRFGRIKFHEVEVIKDILTQSELNKVINKELEIQRLDLVRDIFIFQCYTGLAFIDVYNLRQEHIAEDNNGNLWIMKPRRKTKNMCNIPPLIEHPETNLKK